MCTLISDTRSPAFLRPTEPKMTALRVRQVFGLDPKTLERLGYKTAPRMGDFVVANNIQLVATDDEMDAPE